MAIYDGFDRYFVEASFWGKIKDVITKISRESLKQVLTLYFCLGDSDTPVWAKGIILGTLGYFIFPADLVPDLIPDAGYTDDIGALSSATAAVAMYIKPEHCNRAEERLAAWLD